MTCDISTTYQALIYIINSVLWEATCEAYGKNSN